MRLFDAIGQRPGPCPLLPVPSSLSPVRRGTATVLHSLSTWHNTSTMNSSNNNDSPEYENERDADLLWTEICPADEPTRHGWFLPTVAIILILSVPWYLPRGVGDRLVRGLPLWAWITVVCAAALAVVTSWASLRLWRNEIDGGTCNGDEP